MENLNVEYIYSQNEIIATEEIELETTATLGEKIQSITVSTVNEGLPLVFFILFIFSIGLLIATRISISFSSKKKKASVDYWQQEREANFSRVKPINENEFYMPEYNLTDLHKIISQETNEYSDKTVQKAKKFKNSSDNKMICFKEPRTNLELKQAYGAANLQDIIDYEENFRTYLKSMVELGDSMNDDGHTNEAMELASRAIEVFPNSSGGHILLAKIYHEQNDYNKLEELKNNLSNMENPEIETAVKNKILKKIASFDENNGGN